MPQRNDKYGRFLGSVTPERPAVKAGVAFAFVAAPNPTILLALVL